MKRTLEAQWHLQTSEKEELFTGQVALRMMTDFVLNDEIEEALGARFIAVKLV